MCFKCLQIIFNSNIKFVNVHWIRIFEASLVGDEGLLSYSMGDRGSFFYLQLLWNLLLITIYNSWELALIPLLSMSNSQL